MLNVCHVVKYRSNESWHLTQLSFSAGYSFYKFMSGTFRMKHIWLRQRKLKFGVFCSRGKIEVKAVCVSWLCHVLVNLHGCTTFYDALEKYDTVLCFYTWVVGIPKLASSVLYIYGHS